MGHLGKETVSVSPNTHALQAHSWGGHLLYLISGLLPWDGQVGINRFRMAGSVEETKWQRQKVTSENIQVKGWKGSVWVWRSSPVPVGMELKCSHLIPDEETEELRCWKPPPPTLGSSSGQQRRITSANWDPLLIWEGPPPNIQVPSIFL